MLPPSCCFSCKKTICKEVYDTYHYLRQNNISHETALRVLSKKLNFKRPKLCCINTILTTVYHIDTFIEYYKYSNDDCHLKLSDQKEEILEK